MAVASRFVLLLSDNIPMIVNKDEKEAQESFVVCWRPTFQANEGKRKDAAKAEAPPAPPEGHLCA
jgi:hypothetical protein